MKVFDITLFTIGAIIFSAVTAAIIALSESLHEKGKHQRLNIILFLYFCSHIITNLGYLIYFYDPSLLLWVNSLLLLTLLLIPIFLYRFIFSITTTSASERFSKYHYLAPIILSLMMFLLTITTPVKEQLLTITGNGLYKGHSILFYIFSNKMYFRLVFSIIYIILSFRRLPRYRKYIINYSANQAKSSLRWVNILLLFMLGLSMFPLYGLFVSRSALATSAVTYIQTGFLILQFAYLTFHTTKQHYILQESHTPEQSEHLEESEELRAPENLCESEQPSELVEPGELGEPEKPCEDTNEALNDLELLHPDILKKNTLNKDIFDDFMHEHKPYHNANLKITELAQHIGLNRTYLSSFINSEYDMNFCSYINQLRYNEFQRLKSLEEYKNTTDAELAEMVGFGSYRSYTRFASLLNQDDRRSLC